MRLIIVNSPANLLNTDFSSGEPFPQWSASPRHSDRTILEILQNNISPLKWKLVDFSSARSILRVDWMAKLYQTSKWTAWICFLVILIIGPLSLQGVEIFATQLTNVWVNFEGEKKNCYSLMKWRTFQRYHIPSILLVSGSYKLRRGSSYTCGPPGFLLFLFEYYFILIWHLQLLQKQIFCFSYYSPKSEEHVVLLV